MNRKHFYILFSTILVLCACGGRGKNPKINPMVEELDNTPDNAELVTLMEIDGDSILVQPDNDLENPKVFSYREAEAAGQLKGTFETGELYSILPDKKHHSISICVNVSELRGQWFYDSLQHRGLQFEERGALSSINAERYSYKEWKLLNGKLYLYYVDMQQVSEDRHEFLVDEAEILKLNAEELEFRFLDSVYVCRRQHGLIMF